jgi:hypothetical protein
MENGSGTNDPQRPLPRPLLAKRDVREYTFKWEDRTMMLISLLTFSVVCKRGHRLILFGYDVIKQPTIDSGFILSLLHHPSQ